MASSDLPVKTEQTVICPPVCFLFPHFSSPGCLIPTNPTSSFLLLWLVEVSGLGGPCEAGAMTRWADLSPQYRPGPAASTRHGQSVVCRPVLWPPPHCERRSVLCSAFNLQAVKESINRNVPISVDIEFHQKIEILNCIKSFKT